MPKVRDKSRVRRAKNSYMLWNATRVEDVKKQLNNKMREVNAQLGRVSFCHFSRTKINASNWNSCHHRHHHHHHHRRRHDHHHYHPHHCQLLLL